MSRDSGEPAFPGTAEHYKYEGHAGMSMRDYFAAKAMQAIVHVSFEHGAATEPSDAVRLAAASYVMADAMLAERDK